MTSAVGLRIIHKNTSRKIACKAFRGLKARVWITPNELAHLHTRRATMLVALF